MCRMRRFLAILRSFFHSSLLYTLSFHPFTPTILPFSLTSSCHLFLGLPLSLLVYKFKHKTILGIPFSNIYIFVSLHLPTVAETCWWFHYITKLHHKSRVHLLVFNKFYITECLICWRNTHSTSTECVVCGAWCVVRDMWCVVHDVWCVVCGAWCVVCGARCVVCGAWCVVCGARFCLKVQSVTAA
jgi:hypothetical protein